MNTTKIILTLFLFCLSGIFIQCDKEDLILTDNQDQALSGDENGQGLKKGPPSGGESAVNNLSFPAIAADVFAITGKTENLTVPYTGEYPGLTAEQIAILDPDGDPSTDPWYPQKTEGNAWSAEFGNYSDLMVGNVDGVDWGDNIESVNPMLRRPFRIEVRLFENLASTKKGYTMAELEYPSSSNELQGTNGVTYDSEWATVVSNAPKFIIQHLGNEVPADLVWSGSQWNLSDGSTPQIINMSFGPELNVGGKYIFGGSTGGWKPASIGFYRLTFYIPAGEISLVGADIGNFIDGVWTPAGTVTAAEEGEGAAAYPVVDDALNLSYVDVEVVAGGGGGGGGKGPSK